MNFQNYSFTYNNKRIWIIFTSSYITRNSSKAVYRNTRACKSFANHSHYWIWMKIPALSSSFSFASLILHIKSCLILHIKSCEEKVWKMWHYQLKNFRFVINFISLSFFLHVMASSHSFIIINFMLRSRYFCVCMQI